MAKEFGKYFIAIVPGGEIQEQATQIKLDLREQFNIKYALKSPAHVTLKMPFRWNEAKEDKLIDKLEKFLGEKEGFRLSFKGIGRFGRRVIFIRVEENGDLDLLQKDLSRFIKQELKLIEELSDKSYTAHMTVAFKDIKDNIFDESLKYVKEKGFFAEMAVSKIALLKKGEKNWFVVREFPFKK